MLGQQGTWVCSLGRCCHRLYLTPVDHEEVFAAKNENIWTLANYENYLRNKFWFGAKDKEHSFGREADWDVVVGDK